MNKYWRCAHQWIVRWSSRWWKDVEIHWHCTGKSRLRLQTCWCRQEVCCRARTESLDNTHTKTQLKDTFHCIKSFHSGRDVNEARELSTPPTTGVVHPLKLFRHPLPQHRPPLEVVRVLTRTLIGSVLFSARGGYWSSLNYYSGVY